MRAVSATSDLSGKVVVVTGAARGIGEVTAKVLSRQGAHVALLDRVGHGVDAAAAEIVAGGGTALALTTDVSDLDQVDAAFERIVAELGGVDVLVVNHTVHACGPVLETELVEWELSIGTNVGGAFFCARAAIPSMVARGGGVVLGLGSDCVIRSCRNAAAYMASKAAIVGLMRSIAIDYAAQGVRANVITPGATDTPGLREAFQDRDLTKSLARAAQQSPLQRLAEPEEVADLIAFVCSDRARFVTGTELVVDGGMTISYGAD